MTPEEITTIAREYAEEMCGKEEQSPMYFDIARMEMEEKLRFLLRRYCLVEKSKVSEAYREANDTIQNHRQLYGDKPPIGDEVIPRVKERIRMLSYLFPEIGKEVEG